jgi:hypothetical protein
MKKYGKLAEITKNYLSGDLYRLTTEYNNGSDLKISILYEDEYDYKCEYDIEVHSSTKELDFIGHNSRGVLYKIDLDRDKKFEYAITNYLFSTI